MCIRDSPGAEVKINGKSSITDENGEYKINDLSSSTIHELKAVSYTHLSLYNASVSNKYQASTTVDVVFNKNNKEMLMGTYKGVLILDVTYGD